jgi:hypothetical protein
MPGRIPDLNDFNTALIGYSAYKPDVYRRHGNLKTGESGVTLYC